MRVAELQDPALQAAVSEARLALEAHADAFQAVSGDVIALERYLNECGIRLQVTVVVAETVRDGLRGETIGWTKGDDGWRIRRSHPRWFPTPLLEEGASVRARCQRALPALVRAIAEAVSKA